MVDCETGEGQGLYTICLKCHSKQFEVCTVGCGSYVRA